MEILKLQKGTILSKKVRFEPFLKQKGTIRTLSENEMKIKNYNEKLKKYAFVNSLNCAELSGNARDPINPPSISGGRKHFQPIWATVEQENS